VGVLREDSGTDTQGTEVWVKGLEGGEAGRSRSWA
jgi:hypothetical protein